jgi:hypothetical protein
MGHCLAMAHMFIKLFAPSGQRLNSQVTLSWSGRNTCVHELSLSQVQLFSVQILRAPPPLFLVVIPFSPIFGVCSQPLELILEFF